MGDVAQILGVDATKPPPAAPSTHSSRASKMRSVPKQVLDLVGGDGLPPMVPRNTIKVGNKFIDKDKPARKWAWAPFSSSARTDGLLLSHWVRANVEYPDYPFARFDVHLDPITYSEEEYSKLLRDDKWTKSETDLLMDLARRFELRWSVVHDRWITDIGNDPVVERNVVDLQHRYYHVAARLNASRLSVEAAHEANRLGSAVVANPTDDSLLIEAAAAQDMATSDPAQQPIVHNVGTGTSNKAFDYEYEQQRREYMEALWKRTKAEEAEEAALRKELKEVEAQLRKLKKAGGHVLAAGGNASAASSRNPSRSSSPVPTEAAIQQALASTAPTPVPHVPYLQSSRLAPPATGGPSGLNKSLLDRLEQLLTELNIPEDVVATKRVCDVYDAVRRDALTLLVLQKNIAQKEGVLQTKRLKLSKLGDGVKISDEETLLGIAPPQRPGQKKPTAVPVNKASTTSVKSDGRSAVVKRKRKDTKTPPSSSSDSYKKAKKI